MHFYNDLLFFLFEYFDSSMLGFDNISCWN